MTQVINWLSSLALGLILIPLVTVFLLVCLADDWRKERRARK